MGKRTDRGTKLLKDAQYSDCKTPLIKSNIQIDFLVLPKSRKKMSFCVLFVQISVYGRLPDIDKRKWLSNFLYFTPYLQLIKHKLVFV